MEKQGDLKAVLFDFDGTLAFLPTDYGRTRAKLRNMFSRLGVDSDFRPLMASIKQALVSLNAKGFSQERLTKTCREAFDIIAEEELRAVDKVQPAEGADKTLELLALNGVRSAIVSRNGKACIERSFLSLSFQMPDLIVAREDTEDLKPHPGHYAIALRVFGIEPHEVVIVGDSHHDIEAGRNLGVRTILVAGDAGYEILGTLMPDVTVRKLLDIPWNSLGLCLPPMEETVESGKC